MKVWVIALIFFLGLIILIGGGIFYYSKYINVAKPVSTGSPNIGIFDITVNCTMVDDSAVVNCCKDICINYCKNTGRAYSNHYVNKNNNNRQCYCWC